MLMIALFVLAQATYIGINTPHPEGYVYDTIASEWIVQPTLPKWDNVYGAGSYRYPGERTNQDWLYADLVKIPENIETKEAVYPLPPHREITLADRLFWRVDAIRSYNSALDFAGNYQWAPAAKAFGEAIEKWADFGEAEYGLGVAYHHINQPEFARAHWLKALRIKPGYVEAARTIR